MTACNRCKRLRHALEVVAGMLQGGDADGARMYVDTILAGDAFEAELELPPEVDPIGEAETASIVGAAGERLFAVASADDTLRGGAPHRLGGWHEARRALAGRIDRAEGVTFAADDRGSVWPTVLTWSNEQVAEVERWLIDSTAEMPEVLRGR